VALDIREGDVLVVAGTEYPIKACGEWAWGYVHARGMRRMCSATASTKRTPDMSGGKRGPIADHLTGLRCTPLDPVDPNLAQRLALNTPHELLQSYVDGGDIFYELVVEDLKR